MRVECPKCHEARELTSSLPPGGMSYVCPACGHAFHVGESGGRGGARAGRQKLYVRRSSGKVLGPFPTRVIEQMIRSKQLDAEASVSEDGASFTPIAEHEQFAKLLGVDFSGKVARTSGGGDDLPSPRSANDFLADFSSPGGDLPAAKPVGGDQVPSFDFDLPAAKAPGRSDVPAFDFDLPASKGSADDDLWGLDELPAPQQGPGDVFGEKVSTAQTVRPGPAHSDLPAARDAGWGDLPSPAGNLPSPAGNLPSPQRPGHNLPSPGGNLPSPGGNLPSPGGNLPSPGGNLPSPGGNLPAPGGNLPAAGGNLPSPGGNLPASGGLGRPQTAQVGVPSKPRVHDQVTKSRMDAYKPDSFEESKKNSTQLFGSFAMENPHEIPLMGRGELPVLEEEVEEDVPLMSAGELPFMDGGAREVGGEEDLDMFLMGNDAGTGQPDPLNLGGGPVSAEDDPLGLFGGPADDSLGGDPLGLESEPPILTEQGGVGVDRLAAPAAGGAQRLGPGAPPPLPQQRQVQAPPPYPSSGGESGLPLLESSDGPSLSAPNTARSTNYSERDLEEEEEAFELDLEEHEVAAPAVVVEKPTIAKGKEKGAGGSRAKVLVLVALVLVALGVGFMFSPLGPLGGAKEEAAGGGEGPGEAAGANSELTTEGLELDTYPGYMDYLKKARAEHQATQSPRARGLLLTAIALGLTRYPQDLAPLEREGLDLLAQVQKDEESSWKKLALGAWFAYKGSTKEANRLLLDLAADSELSYFVDLFRGVAAYQEAELMQGSRDERLALLDQAVKNLERIAQREGSPGGAYFLGLSLEAQGKPSQAMRAFGDVIELSPAHTGARLELARLKTANGEFDEAKDQYSAVLESKQASPYEEATAHQIAGQHALSRNDIELAISEFREALELNEDHAEALRGLGDAYIRAKRYQEGIDFFQQRFGKTPKSAEVQLAIAKGYLALSHQAIDPAIMYQQAADVLEQGRQMHDSDPRFPYHLGMLYEAEERISEAETAYQTAIDVAPGFAMAKIQLARLLSTKGTPEADLQASELVKDVQRSELSAEELTALGQFFINRGEDEGGIQLLLEATQRNANWVPARALLVEYYVAQDDINKASEHLDALRRLNALTPQLRYLNAKAHYKRKEYKDAIELMADVVTEEPDNPEYLHFLGLVYFARESYPTARRYFEDAIASDSSYWEAHFYVGRCALEMDENEEALKIFRHVHDERPTNGEYHYWLAVAVGAQTTPGATSQSLRELNQLLQRGGDPEDPKSMFGERDPRPHYQRGRLHRLKGNRSKAEKDFRAALGIDADFVAARADLGRVLFESGSTAFAADELERVREASQGEMGADLYFLLGSCYLDLNKEEEALRAFEIARDNGLSDMETVGVIGLMDPADVHRTLGYLYRDRRRNNEAVEEFELYLRKSKNLDPTTKREIQLEISRLR